MKPTSPSEFELTFIDFLVVTQPLWGPSLLASLALSAFFVFATWG